MKTFKEYNKKHKYEDISNSHGAHAGFEDISNSHGAHATNESDENESPIDKYTGHNDNAHLSDTHEHQIKKLELSHPVTSDIGKDALKKYTSVSRHITSDLIDSHKSGKPVTTQDTNDVTHGLDNHAFSPLKHKLDTYSGTNFDINNSKSVGKSKSGNKVYKSPTYMSSSLDKSIAVQFANRNSPGGRAPRHIMHWHHNEHDPVSVIGSHSHYPEEHEVLIPRTDATPEKHHIEHLRTDVVNNSNGSVYHIHHVRRVPESEIIKN